MVDKKSFDQPIIYTAQLTTISLKNFAISGIAAAAKLPKSNKHITSKFFLMNTKTFAFDKIKFKLNVGNYPRTII